MVQVQLSILCSLILICIGCSSHAPNTTMEANFRNPPHSAKPKTWMHAMSGNMSKEGLTKDLEAMAEVGIGGLLLFNVTQGIPIGQVKYNSEEHHDLIRHAAIESERLGLSFGVHNCDGWSSSGGPWIKPKESMKMVVWSERYIEGGNPRYIQLPQPTKREGFYRDIAVVAYPSLASERQDLTARPVVTASDLNFSTAVATDNRWDNETAIIKIRDEDPWIQFDYSKPHTIRSVFMLFNDRNAAVKLQTSDDGKTFTTARELMKVRTGKGEWAFNDHFDPLTARYFRLQLNGDMTIKETRLLSTYLIDNPLGRTAMARTEDADLAEIGRPEPVMLIDTNRVLDLTAGMDPTGLLYADLPQGDWTIMRFGYTSTGAFNNPASKEGRGLECDKLSRPAFKKHYDAFVGRVVENVRDVAPNAMQYVEIDSYEMGGQNWTDNFEKIFKDRTGYDIIPFLPLIAGRFIQDPETSDAVLWDFRKVISDLMTENYYGYFAELCKEDGLKSYIEPYGFGPLNDLDVGGLADIPMGEFWMNRSIDMVASAVSAARIYGKEIISAESFTSNPEINWKGHPAMAKISGDKAWALGINEFMFHRFAHQANTHVEPGMTMNRWGFHFDRTQTWWSNAGKAWFEYIARGSYLLRQGVPVSDLLVFVGDGAPNSTFSRSDFTPPIPYGINFDCVNADVLINRITCKNGLMVLPEGTAYKALVLKNTNRLTPKTLKRLQEIAEQGIPILGPPPQGPAGHLVSGRQLENFQKMAETIWDRPTTYPEYDWRALSSQHQVTPDLIIGDRKDIEFIHRKAGELDLYFLYNPDSVAQTFSLQFRIKDKIPEIWNPMNGEITKVAEYNQKNDYTSASIPFQAEEALFIVFRESAKGAATLQPLSQPYRRLGVRSFLTKDNELSLSFAQNGQYEATLSTGQHWEKTITVIPPPIQLEGPWQVQFDHLQGSPTDLEFDALLDWKDIPADDIRYYSGKAVYSHLFETPKSVLKAVDDIVLDLGAVHIVAQIRLNGKNLGVLWMPPFRMNITEAVVPGANRLEVEITNQWSNRLIGDERFPAHNDYQLDKSRPTTYMPAWYVNNEPMPASQRTTFCTAPFYKATDPLMPSGLLGPVEISFRKQVTIALDN